MDPLPFPEAHRAAAPLRAEKPPALHLAVRSVSGTFLTRFCVDAAASTTAAEVATKIEDVAPPPPGAGYRLVSADSVLPTGKPLNETFGPLLRGCSIACDAVVPVTAVVTDKVPGTYKRSEKGRLLTETVLKLFPDGEASCHATSVALSGYGAVDSTTALGTWERNYDGISVSLCDCQQEINSMPSTDQFTTWLDFEFVQGSDLKLTHVTSVAFSLPALCIQGRIFERLDT